MDLQIVRHPDIQAIEFLGGGIAWLPSQALDAWRSIMTICRAEGIRRIIFNAEGAPYEASLLDADRFAEHWVELGLDKHYRVAAKLSPDAPESLLRLHRHLEHRAYTLGLRRKFFLQREPMITWLLRND